MASVLKLSGISLPGTHPSIDDFDYKIPLTNLTEVWDPAVGVTLNSTDVSSWSGHFASNVAAQSNALKQPLFVSSVAETSTPGIQYSGTEDLLATTVPISGAEEFYFVMAMRYDATSTLSLLGTFVNSDSVMIGTNSGTPRALLSGVTLDAAAALAANDVAVIGVHITAANAASLRVNGVEVDSGTASGHDITALNLGGTSTSGAWFTDTLLGTALYKGTMSSSLLNEVDTGMRRFLGE